MNTFSDPRFWKDWKGWLIALGIAIPGSAAIYGIVYLVVVVWLNLE